MIFFNRVKSPMGWLGNMSPHKIGRYKTAEAYFQAHRYTSQKIREEICNAASPMTAKMLAASYKEQRAVISWSPEDVSLMRITLAQKLLCNPSLQDFLLDTGSQLIVEDVAGRRNDSALFWGGYMTPQGLQGQNKLGELWCEVRNVISQGLYHNVATPKILTWYINTTLKNVMLPVTMELY